MGLNAELSDWLQLDIHVYSYKVLPLMGLEIYWLGMKRGNRLTTLIFIFERHYSLEEEQNIKLV